MFYTVFARYDGWESDCGDNPQTYSTSGRAVYVTDDWWDANDTWSRWLAGYDTDDYGFYVRRGCVDEHPTLAAAWASDSVAAADDVELAPWLEPTR